jgi:tetratricopeptide (TPR) repeat protein
MLIHTVVELNNKGVHHLQAGDHESARIAFKEALERTTFLLNLKQEAEERMEYDGLDQIEFFMGHPMFKGINLNDPEPNQRQPNTIQRVPISSTLAAGETGAFVYSQALHLSVDCCTNPLLHDFCHRESSVIMFNLALVHHWRGMRFGLTSLLPKALKLYEMSFSLIQHGASFETTLLLLALLNNRGQIHHELTEYDDAGKCFKNLKDMLTAGASQIVGGPDVQGFLMNIMFLESPTIASAA